MDQHGIVAQTASSIRLAQWACAGTKAANEGTYPRANAMVPPDGWTWAAAQPVSRRMQQHGLIEPASYASADIRGKAGSSILDLVLLTMMIFQGFKEIVAFTLAGAGMVVAQPRPSGARSIFEGASDVGKTKAGSTVYEPAGNLYRVTGGGADMWGAADDFHFSWVRVSGDATLTADIQFPWSSKAPLEKAVLIFRQSLDPASAYADNAIHADGHITLQYRATAGGKTADVTAAEHGSTRLRIERSGNRFTAYTGSADGKLTAFSGVTIAMEDPVYVGIGVCAHDAEGLTTVSFSNVSIERHSGSPGANKK